MYYDGYDKIFPYLTAIVNVQNGNVTGITWDDACLFCTVNECEANTYDFQGNLATEEEAKQPVNGCFVPEEECKAMQFASVASAAAADGSGGAEEAGSAGCDLLLYVVFTGTDSKGKDLQSGAYRFSAFPAQSWADRVSQNLPDFVPQSTEDLQALNPIN
jgi:hypothetical protein